MSRRVQVVLDEAEYREIKAHARGRKLTVSEWVRQALRRERERGATRDPERKLDAVSAAYQHGFPTADIEAMLGEIEAGYAVPNVP